MLSPGKSYQYLDQSLMHALKTKFCCYEHQRIGQLFEGVWAKFVKLFFFMPKIFIWPNRIP